MENIENKKRGKKAQPIVWLEGEFTAKDIREDLQRQGITMSNVNIQARINQALISGDLVKLDGTRMTKGHPASLYKKGELPKFLNPQ